MHATRVIDNFKQQFAPVVSVLNWLWTVFVSLLVIVGFVGIMYFTGARDTYLWINAMTWDETQCEINAVYSGRQESTKPESTSVKVRFKVTASYQYRSDFDTHAGTRYDFKGLFGSSYQRVKKDLAYLRSNTNVPCYFNPRKPEQSVINRSFQYEFLIMLIPLFTVGLFAYMTLTHLLKTLGINRFFQPRKKSFLP